VDAMSPRAPGHLIETLSLDAIRALQTHPKFSEAVAATARASIELHQGGRLMNWIMSDRARALMAYMAYYLEVSSDGRGSGLTPTRIKRACADAGLCSPGRAGAMLGLMRASGYIALVTDPADGRIRRLVATDKLKENLRRRLSRQLDAAAPLFPDAADVSTLLGREDFERALIRWLGDQFSAGFRILAHAPDMALFGEHNSGVVILFNLMLSGKPDDAFPPRGPVATSIAGLARRFGVSRTHVLRLLRAAESAGHIERTGEHYDGVILRPHLTQAVYDMLATVYLYLVHGICAAKAEIAETQPRAGV
jgi:DNA-binding MarR family transcriptional regulator